SPGGFSRSFGFIGEIKRGLPDGNFDNPGSETLRRGLFAISRASVGSTLFFLVIPVCFGRAVFLSRLEFHSASRSAAICAISRPVVTYSSSSFLEIGRAFAPLFNRSH